MKLGRPCVDAPTPEQWDLIISRLAARTTTVRNAWTWLHNDGYTMSERTFERLLKSEKTRRLGSERDEAVAATPSLPVVVAVPLGAALAHGAVPHAEPTPNEATVQVPLGSKRTAEDALCNAAGARCRRPTRCSGSGTARGCAYE